MSNFSEIVCQHWRIDPSRYAEAVFWRSVYPRVWFMAAFKPLLGDYFQPDFELIRAVGRARTLAEVYSEIVDFASHPANRRWVRHRLKLRVSGGRLYKLAGKFLSGSRSRVDSGTPFKT